MSQKSKISDDSQNPKDFEVLIKDLKILSNFDDYQKFLISEVFLKSLQFINGY